MIGIIPAAGQASRMLELPKMLLPVPISGGGVTLIDRLHDQMSTVADTFYIEASAMTYRLLRSRECAHTKLYLVSTKTMSETVLEARRHMGADDAYEREAVVFGMPDTYFDDTGVFRALAAALEAGALAAVGVFEARPEQRGKLGMVRVEGSQIKAVVDKPRKTALTQAWGVLAWQPGFWQYIHRDDPHVGYALPRAISAGADVRAVPMRGGFWDCGTPDEYFDLICHLRGKRDT